MSKICTVDNSDSSQAEKKALKYKIFITSTDVGFGIVALQMNAGWCVVLFTSLMLTLDIEFLQFQLNFVYI